MSARPTGNLDFFVKATQHPFRVARKKGRVRGEVIHTIAEMAWTFIGTGLLVTSLSRE